MKSITQSVALSWISQLTYIAAQLVRVRLLYHIFEKGALGTWFLMVSLIGFFAYLELGFAGTFTRFYARGFGMKPEEPQTFLEERKIPIFSFKELAGNAKVIFFLLGIASFFLSFPVGLFYLHGLDVFRLFQKGIAFSWFLLALSQGLLMAGYQYSSLLQGRGYVGVDAMIRTLGVVLSTALLIPIFFFRTSLIYVSFLELFRALSTFYWLKSFSKKHIPEYFVVLPSFRKDMFKTLWKSSFIPFFSSVGGAFFYNTDSLYIASLLNVRIVSDYYNTNQLMGQLFGFCNVLMVSAFPALLSIFGAGNRKAFRSLYYKVMKYSVLLYGIFGIFLLFSGKQIFTLWLGEEHFVGYPILIPLLLFYFFEVQNAIFMNIQFSVEKYPLLWMLWISAGLRFGITFFFLKGLHLHLLGVIFAKLLTQFLAVTWVSAYFFLKTIEVWPLDFRKFQKMVKIYSPLLLLFLIGYFTRFPVGSPFLKLGYQTLAYFSLVFLAGYWWMEKETKEDLLSYVKRVTLR